MATIFKVDSPLGVGSQNSTKREFTRLCNKNWVY